MAKKASKDQGSKATVKKLQADLRQSEAKRAAWKQRAKEAEKTVADLKRGQPAGAESEATTPATEDGAGPDASWTVVQLRAEARRRGISGLSGKSKAELVKALG